MCQSRINIGFHLMCLIGDITKPTDWFLNIWLTHSSFVVVLRQMLFLSGPGTL